MHPARDAALATIELLENIIRQLPSKDITASPRVSKTWHSLITTSKAIRKAMMLSPVIDSKWARWQRMQER